MKAEDKLQILKFLLMLVNSFFVILGISLFGCSVWILFDKDNFIAVLSSEEDVKVVAGGLFIIGLVVVFVSVLGCIGVHLENRCFVAFYMGLLITIVLGQLFVTFLLLLKRNQIEAVLTKSTDGIIADYVGNSTQTSWRLLDSVQQSAKCCGRKSASDWQTNHFIQTLNMTDIYPCSCFNVTCPMFLPNESYPFGKGSDIYTTGCGVKLSDWLETNILVIVGMDFGLLAIQILQFALGFHIYRNIGLKIKDKHNSLLEVMEENPTPEPSLHQSDEDYQPDENYNQQPQSVYNQESVEQSYEDQHYQHRHDLEANSQLYDHQQNRKYHQDESEQAYDLHPYQHYQHYDSEPTRIMYNHKHDNAYDQEYITQNYNGYQDQHYQNRNDPQIYDGKYNQGYVHNYDYRNNYDNN